MKTIEEQGGFAFPCADEYIVVQEGMTLRDWFAGMALQGMTSNSRIDSYIESTVLASSAYNIADAMLEARKK